MQNTKRCEKKEALVLSYKLDGVHLERVTEEKDLRVTITNSLSCDTQREVYTLVPSHPFLSTVKCQVNLKSKQVSCKDTTSLSSYLSLFRTGLHYGPSAITATSCGELDISALDFDTVELEESLEKA